MPHGPLEVLVVNFEDTNFTGEIEAELIRLEQSGTVRVLDILFVGKSLEGEISVLRTSDVHTGALTQALLDRSAGNASVDDPDVWSTADAVEPGNAAAIVVLEHRWALPLYRAISAAGGVSAVTQPIAESDLAELGVTLPAE
jgi:hypothetical protein